MPKKCCTRATRRPRNMATGYVLRKVKANAKLQVLIVTIVTWQLAWKGFSMWRAARNDSKPWFVALLAINSMGVLDSFYLFVVDRRHRRKIEASLVFSVDPDMDPDVQDVDRTAEDL